MRMKKIFYLIIFLLLSIFIFKCDFLPQAFANNQNDDYEREKYEVNTEFGFKIFNLLNDSEEKASKVFYEFMMKNSGDEIKRLKKISVTMQNFSPKTTPAVEVDLNDDGISEIIGYIAATPYGGAAGQSLFILWKDKNGVFKDICYLISFEPQKKIYILKDKDGDFHRIIIYGSVAYDFKPFLIQYNDGQYSNYEQYKSFVDMMKNFADYDVSPITSPNN